MKHILMYLPVIHAGYERFLAKHYDADSILILGESFIAESKELSKEIRALSPQVAADYLNSTGRFPTVQVIERNDASVLTQDSTIVVPDEQAVREVVSSLHLVEQGIEVTYEKTFLRWDREWAKQGKPVHWDSIVTVDEMHVCLALEAISEAQRSSDWWRQVGAVLIAPEAVLEAHNEHLPNEYTPYLNSDPRNALKKGTDMDLFTAIHAEANVIAQAAARGLKTRGAYMYVTTFPCPNCANLIAVSGIKRLFFSGGYTMLEGEEVLRRAGVQLVFVDLENNLDNVVKRIETE